MDHDKTELGHTTRRNFAADIKQQLNLIYLDHVISWMCLSNITYFPCDIGGRILPISSSILPQDPANNLWFTKLQVKHQKRWTENVIHTWHELWAEHHFVIVSRKRRMEEEKGRERERDDWFWKPGEMQKVVLALPWCANMTPPATSQKSLSVERCKNRIYENNIRCAIIYKTSKIKRKHKFIQNLQQEYFKFSPCHDK